MIWKVVKRNDNFAREIADRHYNRQKVGTPGFAPPGRCLVLTAETDTGRALWITSWPYAEYVKHRWAGAWVCSAFRNEGAGVASEMIAQAVAVTRAYYGEPPLLGMITFLDRKKVRPTMVRGKPTWGRTWELAGFRQDGQSVGGLLALRLPPCSVPPPRSAGLFCGEHKHFRTPSDLRLDADIAWLTAP